MYPTNIHNKRILFAVLNWGLGHATRSSVLIKQLLNQGNTIDIASSGNALHFLAKEFPALVAHAMPAFEITYPKKQPLLASIMFQFPKMLLHMRRAKKKTGELQKKNNYDIIISDNYYGCYDTRCTNIFITHQIKPYLPTWLLLGRQIVYWLNKYFINQFDACWIPDNKELMLAKDFTGNLNIPTYYIGILSRFGAYKQNSIYDSAIILSGPEPARSLLEIRLLNELLAHKKNKKIILVRGSTSLLQLNEYKNIDVIDVANTQTLQKIISQSRVLYSRSGYSSIMDYYFLANKVILIPTKGQPEQEQLCKHPLIKKRFNIMHENQPCLIADKKLL